MRYAYVKEGRDTDHRDLITAFIMIAVAAMLVVVLFGTMAAFKAKGV